jgi:hypothetical protein
MQTTSRCFEKVDVRISRRMALAIVPVLCVGLSVVPATAHAHGGIAEAAPAPASLRLTPATAMSFRAPPLTLQTDTSATPPPRGLGLLITGSVVTGAVGLPFVIWGSAVAAAGARVTDGGAVAGAPFLAVGLIGLAAGVPMLAVGAVRMKKYNQWKSQHAFVPTAGRTAMGTWTGGVSFAF